MQLLLGSPKVPQGCSWACHVDLRTLSEDPALSHTLHQMTVMSHQRIRTLPGDLLMGHPALSTQSCPAAIMMAQRPSNLLPIVNTSAAGDARLGWNTCVQCG